MKYWEEYQSKWGFGDGDNMPPDAWARRYVYVREINKRAAAKGSAVRLFAYDRWGVHNPYLILVCPAEAAPEDALSMCSGGFDWLPADGAEYPGFDDAMEEAIDECDESGIDNLVSSTVRIDGKPEREFRYGQ